jgi:hypothetical protein
MRRLRCTGGLITRTCQMRACAFCRRHVAPHACGIGAPRPQFRNGHEAPIKQHRRPRRSVGSLCVGDRDTNRESHTRDTQTTARAGRVPPHCTAYGRIPESDVRNKYTHRRRRTVRSATLTPHTPSRAKSSSGMITDIRLRRRRRRKRKKRRRSRRKGKRWMDGQSSDVM